MCINQSTTSRIMSDYEYGITQAVAEKENAIFSGQSIFTTDDVSGRMNKDWVLGSFMIGTLNSDTLEKVDVLNRTFTSAQLTFVDSSTEDQFLDLLPFFDRMGVESAVMALRIRIQTKGHGNLKTDPRFMAAVSKYASLIR